MSEMKTTGIDLAGTNFYLFSTNTYGKPADKIKRPRSRLLNWLAQQLPMAVAMEVCGVSPGRNHIEPLLSIPSD